MLLKISQNWQEKKTWESLKKNFFIEHFWAIAFVCQNWPSSTIKVNPKIGPEKIWKFPSRKFQNHLIYILYQKPK